MIMAEINWEAVAKIAQNSTDTQFKNKMSSLTLLTDEDILSIVNDIGISKVDLVQVLKNVADSSSSNADKAEAIRGIDKGVNVLVALASRFLI
jgi:hypothetical protein